MPKITILDYGVGNLRSVEKAFHYLSAPAKISSEHKEIDDTDILVMPGQGAFGAAMKMLKELGMAEKIKKHIKAGKKFLGICVGFQLLFEKSQEKGTHQGLGILPGKILRFPENELSVPHMGWNTLTIAKDPNGIFQGINKELFVYFVHSYYVYPKSTDKSIISTITEYGLPFVSAIQKDNILATQFHPEKSGEVGLQIMRDFLLI